jgi:uncharacterized protein YhfF
MVARRIETLLTKYDELLRHVGKRMVMLDGTGRAAAVLETVELTRRRFSEVDEAFAFDEGEGDQTLAYWREAHRSYFQRFRTR